MSGGTRLENANPVIFQRSGERLLTANDEDEDVHDPIDDREIFDILFLTESFSGLDWLYTWQMRVCSFSCILADTLDMRHDSFPITFLAVASLKTTLTVTDR